jgi:cell division protein ZapA
MMRSRETRGSPAVKSALEVTIAGQRYVLRGDDGEARLREVADLVNETFERLRAAGSGASTERLAILAAVNLADELLRERQEWGATAAAIHQRTERLIVCLKSLAPLAAAADEQRPQEDPLIEEGVEPVDRRSSSGA